jgi:hypothetical protein
MLVSSPNPRLPPLAHAFFPSSLQPTNILRKPRAERDVEFALQDLIVQRDVKSHQALSHSALFRPFLPCVLRELRTGGDPPLKDGPRWPDWETAGTQAQRRDSRVRMGTLSISAGGNVDKLRTPR